MEKFEVQLGLLDKAKLWLAGQRKSFCTLRPEGKTLHFMVDEVSSEPDMTHYIGHTASGAIVNVRMYSTTPLATILVAPFP
ncbi:MAG TPA: hypothetical protein VD907_05630 [Verrucomicrobiae bacterium]|nr:hypothetical protein [Verrucomicrobiae bacterium]